MLYYTILHRTILSYTTQYHITLNYTILYYTISTTTALKSLNFWLAKAIWMEVTTININITARYYLVTLQPPHGHALFIFHFSDKDSVETFNQKRKVSSVVKSQRQMFLQVSQLRKRRGGQRNQANPTEGRTGPVRLHSCLLVFVCFSLSGLAIRQQIALRPTSLLCRPPAALLSNHPERATRWDTLTLASDVMQDFQKKEKLLVHALCLQNWIPMQTHTHSPTTEMLIHTPADASVFPSSLQTLSNRSCCQ